MGGLVLEFEGFRGSAHALYKALKEGQLRPANIPIARIVAQALAQAEGWPLLERARLAPELARLVLLWLGEEERGEAPEEAARTERAVAALLDLEAAVQDLARRAEARRDLIPLPPAPVVGGLRLAADPRRLARLAPPARPRPVLAAIAGFGLREAWRRLRALLAAKPRARLEELAPRRFVPKAVHLAALLEAARRGWVALRQAEPYGTIEVERLEGGGELAEAV